MLYAIPQGKIIGIAKVNSHPVWNGNHARWPWRSKVSLQLAIANYDRAPELADIREPSGRDLSQSVQRQSHIELRWGEFVRARDALEAAFDSAQGDLGAVLTLPC